MSFLPETQTTSISTHNNDDIFIRDKSLCNDLIGKLGFTEMLFFQILGRAPTAAECTVVDACLVTLMEHGLTPSALATRLVYSSATESMQGAVAAGLLSVGSLFVGTMEGAAALIKRILSADDVDAEAVAIAREHKAAKKPLPGFGHHMHKPDDPRSIRLFEVAKEQGVSGKHIAAIKALSVGCQLKSCGDSRLSRALPDWSAIYMKNNINPPCAQFGTPRMQPYRMMGMLDKKTPIRAHGL
jgi:citrate synthase